MKRFWDKVTKTETCWIWTAATTRGYGQFWRGDRQVQAHRYAYEQGIGRIPEGLQIDHLCKNKRCVNPKHLEPVTAKINTSRRPQPNSLKTECKYGHPYTPENTFINKFTGGRSCKKCNAARSYRNRRICVS